MPLVPPYVAALSAAAPARAGEGPARDAAPVAWLDANENALGPSPRAVEAAREAAARAHRYPDASAAALRAALAAKLGVEPREVLVGNGSSELVELLVRTFVLDGEDVLTSAQTWPAYRLAAQVHGRKLVEAPMKARHGVDLEAIKKLLSRRTKLVFLANPDSPTGTCLLEAELTPFLDAVPKDTLVVLDEAYVEFADAPGFPDALALRRRYPNLVVLRTFSKVHGLAGLRVGYGVARPDVADYIERVRPPHDVNAIAQAAGVAALADDAHVARSRALVLEERPFLAAGLAALGATVPPSQANFVLADFGGRPAKELADALLREGVAVRPLAAWGFPNAVRVAVGTREQSEACLAVLGKVLGK